jgi:hypothetical protein
MSLPSPGSTADFGIRQNPSSQRISREHWLVSAQAREQNE